MEQIVLLLVQGNYFEIERLTQGVRLNATALEQAVVDYGRKLIIPREGCLTADIVEIEGSWPKAWSINVPLFTLEEGFSDLTLSLTVRELELGNYQVEIDDLHVL